MPNKYFLQYYRDDSTQDIRIRRIPDDCLVSSLLSELAGHPSTPRVVGFDISGEQCYMRDDGQSMSTTQLLAIRNGEYDTI